MLGVLSNIVFGAGLRSVLRQDDNEEVLQLADKPHNSKELQSADSITERINAFGVMVPNLFS